MSPKSVTQMTEALQVILRVSAQNWTTWICTKKLSDTMSSLPSVNPVVDVGAKLGGGGDLVTFMF